MSTERTPLFSAMVYLFLGLALASTVTPLYLTLTTASASLASIDDHGLPLWFGDDLWRNMTSAWSRSHLGRALVNSMIVSLAVVAATLAVSAMSAYAIVFFKAWYRPLFFWAILLTLMLPLEVRVVPTYAIVTNLLSPLQLLLDGTGVTDLIARLCGDRPSLAWNLLDTYAGLILPLVATATGTFLLRQTFLGVPSDLAEAARLDGAGPIRYFLDILLPLARPDLAALAAVTFLGTWNLYLWPSLITTDPAMRMVVPDIAAFRPVASDGSIQEWNVMMAAAVIALIPPMIAIVFAQRYFGHAVNGSSMR